MWVCWECRCSLYFNVALTTKNTDHRHILGLLLTHTGELLLWCFKVTVTQNGRLIKKVLDNKYFNRMLFVLKWVRNNDYFIDSISTNYKHEWPHFKDSHSHLLKHFSPSCSSTPKLLFIRYSDVWYIKCFPQQHPWTRACLICSVKMSLFHTDSRQFTFYCPLLCRITIKPNSFTFLI